jgi:hypothetical protein
MKKLAITLLFYLMMTSVSHSELHFLKTFGNAGTGNGEFNLALNSYIVHDDMNIL